MSDLTPNPASGISRRQLLGTVTGMMLSGCISAKPEVWGEWLLVNGNRQWVAISGSQNFGPAILVLHGGPGGSETILFRHFNRDLERHCKVIYWDQRGAGRSYDPKSPPAGMNIAQFIADLGEVVRYVRRRLDRPLILLGHSWGAALGLLYSGSYAGTVDGVICVAPMTDAARQEAASYIFAMREATRLDNRLALRQLERIGPPPHELAELKVKNRWVKEFGGYFAPGFSEWSLVWTVLSHGEASLGDVRHTFAANDYSLASMWAEVRTLDVSAVVQRIDVPVAFLLGRMDQQCPSSLSATYFDSLIAPSKKLVWFERSAHNLPFEQPAAFNRVVPELIQLWT